MEIKKIYPLSPLQSGMLFHFIKDQKSHAYFEQTVYEYNGNLDIDILNESYNRLIKRYDILRTLFIYENVEKPIQVVVKERSAKITILDFLNLEKDNRNYELEKYCEDNRIKGFDLSKDILFRITVIKKEEESYWIVLEFHHIIMDGWCLGIILQELLQIYTSLKKSTELTLSSVVPYSNYIDWIGKQDKQAGIDFWKSYLLDYEKVASLPILTTAEEGGILESDERCLELSEKSSVAIETIAKQNNVTPNTFFQSLWGVFLQKYTNTNDVVFGVVVSGRPSEVIGIEKMVGLCINTVPCRVNIIHNQTFLELLLENQAKNNDAKAYEYMQLSEIQSHSKLKSGLINHILTYENYPFINNEYSQDNDQNINYKMKWVQSFGQTNFNFAVRIIPGNNFRIEFRYNKKNYKEDFVEKLSSQFNELIKQIISNVNCKLSDINLLSDIERKRILNEFNNTKADYPKDKTIHQLFEEQVESSPDSVALVFNDELLTYRELNNRSNLLSYLLISKGIKRRSIVGIMLDRSIEMVVAIISVLKAGGAYCPIDYKNPDERIKYILNDNGARVLISKKHLLNDFEFNGELVCVDDYQVLPNIDETPEIKSTIDDFAYLIYTSGTTGKPKGVLVNHSNVANLINSFKQSIYNNYKNKLNVSLISPLYFDASVKQIFPSLCIGHKLNIVPEKTLLNPVELVNFLVRYDIEIADGTPSHLQILLENNETKLNELNVSQFIIGGEELKYETITKLYDLTCQDKLKITNVYGPTECTDVSTQFTYDGLKRFENERIPIGKPIFNSKIFILGKDNQIAPIGVSGELCISGENLSLGYLNQPELTLEKFIDHPFEENACLYKTGDLSRWLPNGNIEFLGRVDDQVKIRGFRIELGEIEKTLLKINGVKEAVVIERTDNGNAKYLCAYIVPTKLEKIDDNIITPNKESFKNILEQNNTKFFNEISERKANIIANEIQNVYDDSTALSKKEQIRYTRQMMMYGWGIESQEVLKGTTVFVAGAGGIGSPIIQQLALLGIGHIIICDFDTVDLSNLNRQVLHDESRIGMNKAVSAKLSVERINPFVKVTVIKEKVTNENIDIFIEDASVIFDCVDDLETKFVLSKSAVKNKIPHVLSVMMEINSYFAFLHAPHTPCFKCLHNENVLEENKIIKSSKFYKKHANPVSSPALFVCTGYAVNETVKYLLGFDNLAYNKFFFFNQFGSEKLTETNGYKILSYTYSEHFKRLSKQQGFDWDIGWNNKFLVELDIEKDTECSLCESPIENKSILNKRKIKTSSNYTNNNKVALMMDDPESKLIEILGILKSGMTTILLDPCYSGKFIKNVIEDSEIRLIITDTRNKSLSQKIKDDINKRISLINIDEIKFNEFDQKDIINYKVNQKKPNCWVYSNQKEMLTPKVLRKKLENILPDYMVPSYFVELDKIPLTANGKVNRNALPSPEISVSDDYIIPSNETEENLITIWSKVLNIPKEKISVTDNFFDIGGESLKAVILTYKINSQFGVNISIRDLFEKPSIKELASILVKSDLLGQKELPKAKFAEYFSMTQTQQRLLFMQNLEPNSKAFNLNLTLELNELVSENKVRQALQEIVNRHESLRTYFELKDNEMKQRVVPDINVEIYSKHVIEEILTEEINEFVKSFDLNTPPLFRVGCFTTPQKRILVFNAHHIILDGHSIQILKREFYDILEGKELPKVKYQFRDYVAWIEGKEQQERIEKSEQFWKKELEGGIPEINLPYDKNESTGNKSQQLSFTLDKEISDRLFELAKDQNVTMFSLVASIYSIFLANITMMKEVVFGLPVYGRNHYDLENIIGMFVNNVAVKSKIDDKGSFGEFLQNLHKRCLGILEHQDYSFSSVISKICQLKSNPINADLIFNQLNSDNEYDKPNKEQPIEINFEIKADIALYINRNNDNILFLFHYNGERFLESTISSFNDILLTIIKSITEDTNVLIESLLHSPGFESVSSVLEDDFFTNIENAEFNE